MKLASLLLVVYGFVSTALLADDWMGARPIAVFSDDGSRFARIIPGPTITADCTARAPEERCARALFYLLQPDRSYKLVADIALQNPNAPVRQLLTNRGYLITFDNWNSLGYGKVVAIYRADGSLVQSWELDQLYSREELQSIRVSASSRWWRCVALGYVDPREQTQVYVSGFRGGNFIFNLEDGSFTYSPGQADCHVVP